MFLKYMINYWKNIKGKTLENNFQNIAIIGDSFGIQKLSQCIEQKRIKCIVGASIRPQYFDKLGKLALKLKVPFLIQPKYKTLEYKQFLRNLKSLKIDMLVCYSYSMLIRKDILRLINYNAINLHSSLLPKNRGPNPIQWAIIKGETKTGVTIHYMDNDIDTGDIISQIGVSIGLDDTWVSVNEKLKIASDNLLSIELKKILKGKNNRIKQDEKFSTTNFRLDANYPKIDFKRMSDIEIYNLIRAQVKPLKGAYIENCKEKIHFNEKISLEEIKKLREIIE